MRHRKAGRQLRRTSEQKLALLRNLATSLIESESIETTEAKAKELRPFVEKLDHQGPHRHAARAPAGRSATSSKREAADKLFQEIGPRFATRNGGYTRILKTGHRKGDGAEMARIEFCRGLRPWPFNAIAASTATRASRSATTSRTRTTRRAGPGSRISRSCARSSTARSTKVKVCTRCLNAGKVPRAPRGVQVA